MRKLAGTALVVASLILAAWVGSPAHAAPLSKREINELLNEVSQAVKDQDWRRAADTLDRLSEADDKKVFKLMIKVAEQAPPHAEMDLVLIRAAANMTDKGVLDEVKRAARKSRASHVRRACIVHLGKVGGHEDILIDALEDSDEKVAAIAAWKLVDNRVEAAVEPMIKQLEKVEKNQSGIWDVLKKGLGSLLGKECGSAVEYQSLWTLVKEQGGIASVEPKTTGQAAPAGRMESRTARLFGTEIDCTRVVFILDVSGSMEAIDPDQKLYDSDQEGGSRERAGPGSSGAPEKPPLKTRMERAQRELVHVLKKLPANFKVNVIAYSSGVQLWRAHDGDIPPQLHPLNEPNRQAVIEWVQNLKASGTTATDTALLRGYEIDGARCFYLLSDGFPTHDGRTPVPTSDILAVLEKFKERHVIVHTLGFKGADRDMMQAVAKKSGGNYTDIQ